MAESFRDVAVIGAGGWGTAVAVLLAGQSNVGVRLWARSEARARELDRGRENRDLLPGIAIPPGVRVTPSAEEATDSADLIVVAVPMVHLRATLRGFPPAAAPVLSLTKGIEPGSGAGPCDVIRMTLSPPAVGVLSGPSHAEEVARGMPSSVVVASEDDSLAGRVQTLFTTQSFRVYTSDDRIGVELGGALKNVIGLAAGICDGLGFGDNAKSALITRGLAEMRRYGVARGARPETFDGLAGMGDLITTCFSPHGRNRRVGERVGRGEPLGQILSELRGVAEGVETCRALTADAAARGVEMPITAGTHAILFEGRSPVEVVGDLMTRPPREERDAGRPSGQTGGDRV